MENVSCAGDVTLFYTSYKLSDMANGDPVLPSTETDYLKKLYV
jgi:hypothetical protein